MTPASGVEARMLAPGEASGPALVLEEPLSFWGGVDPRSGEIIDAHHPQRGERVTARILCMPSGRGSSSSSSVFAESIRAGTGPAAILLREPDPILAVGAVVAAELYGTAVPVGVLPASAYGTIRTDDRIRLAGARVFIRPGPRDAPR